jgi:DNA-binding response OmpR family regulator
MLVQRGILPPPKLKEALDNQGKSSMRLATQCFHSGLASEDALLSALSAQVGVPGVQITRLVLPLRFLEVVSEQDAHRNTMLPVRVDPERIFLAMADPINERLVSEVAFTSGRKVLTCVALQGPLQRAIKEAYTAKRNGELEYRGERAEGDADGAMLFFVFAEELTQVPRELIESLGGQVERKSDEAEILIATDEAGEVELEVSISENNTVSLGQRRSGEHEQLDGKPRVLVVDDDPELRRLVTRMLGNKGFVVEEAARGLEALNRIRSSPPDLLLLDAMLPEVHGFDICRKIKASDRYGDIPVIMISSIYRGWRFARDLKEAYGVAAFLEKPFDIQVLLDTVDRVLSATRRKGNQGGQRQQISSAAKKAIQTGVNKYRSGDLDGAIECYREGIHIDPLSAKLHYQLAILYLKKKGMTYQAMQEFEEAVALDPEMFPALRNLAILYQSKGFKNKAIDLWERALRCSPDDDTRDHIRKHVLSLI